MRAEFSGGRVVFFRFSGIRTAKRSLPRCWRWAGRSRGDFLDKAPPGQGGKGWVRRRLVGSAAVHGERSGAEQILEGPAGGEVNADTASGLAYACANFEQLRAQGFDLCRTPGQR